MEVLLEKCTSIQSEITTLVMPAVRFYKLQVRKISDSSWISTNLGTNKYDDIMLKSLKLNCFLDSVLIFFRRHLISI